VHDRGRLPLLAAIALVLVAGGLGTLGGWFLFRGAPWGFALIGLGVLLWASTTTGRHRTPAVPHTPAGTPGSSLPPPTAGTAGVTTTGTTGTTGTTRVTATGPVTARVATPRRPRRYIGLIGVGVAALFTAFTAIAGATDWFHLATLWVVVVGVAIVMAALVVSTVVNRSWFLPAPFLLLAAVLVPLCVAQPRLDGGSGTRSVRPSTVAAAEQAQYMSTGELTIDLRGLPDEAYTAGTALDVRAEVGIGRLRVLVPTDVLVHVTTGVGMGVIMVDDVQVAEGVRQHDVRDAGPVGSDTSRTVSLHLRVGMGRLDVVREP
jgi:hypothetical protein